jgi:hypothetical protein
MSTRPPLYDSPFKQLARPARKPNERLVGERSTIAASERRM